MPSEPVSAAKVALDVIKGLLGPAAPVVFIASGLFLFLPDNLLTAISVDSGQPVLRSWAGISFLVSGVACAVLLGRYFWLAITSAYKWLLGWFRYLWLSDEALLALIFCIFNHCDRFCLPANSGLSQAIVESRFFFASRRVGQDWVEIILTGSGEDFLARFRPGLRRREASVPEKQQEEFIAQIERARDLINDRI